MRICENILGVAEKHILFQKVSFDTYAIQNDVLDSTFWYSLSRVVFLIF